MLRGFFPIVGGYFEACFSFRLIRVGMITGSHPRHPSHPDRYHLTGMSRHFTNPLSMHDY